MRNRSNDSNYHWDYQDYRGNYGQSPARARKSSGLKYFLIAMGVVILLVGALCVGASVWGSKPAPQPDQDSSIGNELEHLPEIDQQNKPEDNVPDTTEDGLLTPAGIYKKCAPSVVGIITYGSSATAQGRKAAARPIVLMKAAATVGPSFLMAFVPSNEAPMESSDSGVVSEAILLMVFVTIWGSVNGSSA